MSVMTAFWSDYDTDYARSLINVVTLLTVCSSNLGLNSQRSRAVTSFEIMKTIEAAVGTARQTAARWKLTLFAVCGTELETQST